MNFDEYKKEEATLVNMISDHLEQLEKDPKMAFMDGLKVGFFVDHCIEWYRYKKSIENNFNLTRGQKDIYELCESIQKEYGFDLTVDKVRENIIKVVEHEDQNR